MRHPPHTLEFVLRRMLSAIRNQRSCHWCTAYVPNRVRHINGFFVTYCSAEHAALDRRSAFDFGGSRMN
jgi:hypothetical protein